MSISILMAEDDPLLRTLLFERLSALEDFTMAGCAGTGLEALEAVEKTKPDVLLLDWYLPDLSGLEVMERLAGREGAPAVLVLSGDEAEATQLKAAQSGALGFLCKSEAIGPLPDAVRTVAGGEVWFNRQIMRRIVGEYTSLVHTGEKPKRPYDLSKRECEVLARVAGGMTNHQIARDLFVSVSTVKVHIRHILKKLNLPNRTEAAVFAVRQGLLEPLP